MSEERFCYVGRQPGCGCIGLVVVDDPQHAKDTAKSVSDAVIDGLTIERMNIVAFRADAGPFGCQHDIKMAVCRKRGLNTMPAAAGHITEEKK